MTSSPTRTVLSTTAYAPFGEAYAQEPQPATTADLSFTGENSDTVNGDYDFLNREYSTEGRWPSPDPTGRAAANPMNPQSWNRYAYVLNNPLSLVDPLGLDCAYLNDSGTGIEENGIDTNSNQSECNQNGGVWGDGTILALGIDPNSNDVNVISIYSDPNGFLGLEMTKNGSYAAGGQTWTGAVATANIESNWAGTNSGIGLNALQQAYNLASGPMNVMSVVFVAETGGILGVEASPAAIWAYNQWPTAVAAANTTVVVGVESSIGWNNVYAFVSGFASSTRYPSTPTGWAGYVTWIVTRNAIQP